MHYRIRAKKGMPKGIPFCRRYHAPQAENQDGELSFFSAGTA
jgi:hypothetical protein